MSMMSEAIGGFRALNMQATFYRTSELASQGKALAMDIAKRAGTRSRIGYHAAAGAVMGGVAGGAYGNYEGRGTMRGAIGGAVAGAGLGAGYAIGGGVRSSFRGGGIRDYMDVYKGQYNRGLKGSIAGSLGRASRMANATATRRANSISRFNRDAGMFSV